MSEASPLALDASASTFSSKTSSSGRARRKIKHAEAVKSFTHDEFMAAAIGDTSWLKQALKGGKGASNFDRNGLAAIHLAALHGRLGCLKFLVESCRVDIDLSSSTGWRPLHLAINSRTGKRGMQCVQYLLERGAHPSLVNDDMLTPSHQAAIEGSAKCLESLIAAGANINLADAKGHIPLDYAKIWGHRICARLLASEGWKRDKEIQSQQMMKINYLTSLKEEEERLLREVGEDEREVMEDASFSNWLAGKRLQRRPTGPDSLGDYCRVDGFKGEKLQRANSKPRPIATVSPAAVRVVSKSIQSGRREDCRAATKATPGKREPHQSRRILRMAGPARWYTVRKKPQEFWEHPQYELDRMWLERMSEHDRPLTFKCNNIVDTQHKKLLDEDQKPTVELYGHISDCVHSALFPRPTDAPNAADGDLAYDINRMTHAFQSWSTPGRFPAIDGNEYNYAFEAF